MKNKKAIRNAQSFEELLVLDRIKNSKPEALLDWEEVKKQFRKRFR